MVFFEDELTCVMSGTQQVLSECELLGGAMERMGYRIGGCLSEEPEGGVPLVVQWLRQHLHYRGCGFDPWSEN